MGRADILLPPTPPFLLQPPRTCRPPLFAGSVRPRHSRVTYVVSEAKEVRVCVNRTCSRSGSRETLALLEALAPPGMSVVSCGCLGLCGSGPNVAILPDEVVIRHCSTASRVADLLTAYCGFSNPAAGLEALALRKRAEGEMDSGNLTGAIALLNQAVDLKPAGGMQFIYKARSAAQLGMGDHSGALQDAIEASKIAPDYPQAYICQGDVFFAMEEYDAAAKAYSTALQIDPSIRRSTSYKARIAKLQVKMSAANVS
ncbi:Small glutamine-rich tetratricopeptide repeat-containing protein alpha [Nymphaea thermarum]|nr:Small glutamine-rich tetratricopeptide repeat-containing protein alpha [Nymphaea thermarum]